MSQCRALDSAERLLVGIVRQAVRDAQQEKDARLREDALRWLWSVAPTVAERVVAQRGVPALQYQQKWREGVSQPNGGDHGEQ